MGTVPPNMTDYDHERRTLRLEVPERFNFASDVVDRWAAADEGKLAMLWIAQEGDERRFSFGYFRDQSNRFASGARRLGIGPGDGVLVVLPRLPEWYIVLLGLMKLGAVPMPGTTLLTAKDIAYRIKCADVKMIVTSPETAARVEEIQVRPTAAMTSARPPTAASGKPLARALPSTVRSGRTP